MTTVVTSAFDNLRQLGLRSSALLLAWKVRQRTREFADRKGGSERLGRERVRWVADWLADHDGIREWLHRPGAGEWWFDAPAADWARRTCTDADMDLAGRAARGEFRLLGATSRLSDPPEWRRDLYSGLVWPLDASSRLRIVRADGSDIRTVWELSRCYHFLALARAWASSGDPSWPATFARHVDSFREQNPIGYGPHWASPMDVAIRSANWAIAIPLFADADLHPAFWAAVLADLRAAGLWIERHLEWHPVYRGNHYIANLVGLTYLGTLFRGSRDGERWLDFASEQLQREIRFQIGDDGVALEGSLAYHRLHTELFAYGGELLRRNAKAFDAPRYDERLGAMVRFISAYLQPDDQAPMMGDADDGRLHAISARALAEPRRHGEGLPERWRVPPPRNGAFSFPEAGFHVLRHGGNHAVVRCGPVGLRGAGSHDHNDQLSFELVLDGMRVVADSGTYVYTRDLGARFAFRATSSHSVVQVAEAEQNPISVERPWRVLADRTHARVMRCEIVDGGLLFSGEHYGYERVFPPVVCRRTIQLDHASCAWTIEDEIVGTGMAPVRWRLHLGAGELHIAGGVARWEADGGGAVFYIETPRGLELHHLSSTASDKYGTTYSRPVLELSGTTELPVQIRCRITQRGEND